MLSLIRDFKYGRPQFFATLLLLVFLAQVLWLAARVPPLESEIKSYGAAVTPEQAKPREHSAAVVALIKTSAATPLLSFSWELPGAFTLLAIRLPFIFFGWFLGASIWWVARRLYSNAGGYVALSLLVFCPLLLRASSIAAPEIIAAACAFGVVFTAIGIAHILHASPKKWVLRPLLLGFGSGVAAAAMPSAAWAFAIGAAFTLYLAEGVVARALAMLGTTFVLGATLSAVVTGIAGEASVPLVGGLFQPQFGSGLGLIRLSHPTALYLQHLPMLILFVMSVAVLVLWKRARYFGNYAPLLAGVALLPLIGIAALPFFFVFIAGVAADLIESSYARWTINGLAFLMAMQAVFSIASVIMRSAS